MLYFVWLKMLLDQTPTGLINNISFNIFIIINILIKICCVDLTMCSKCILESKYLKKKLDAFCKYLINFFRFRRTVEITNTDAEGRLVLADGVIVPAFN